MRVKAIEIGYYGDSIRQIDAEFDITEAKHFSKRWMEKVETSVKKDNPARESDKE